MKNLSKRSIAYALLAFLAQTPFALQPVFSRSWKSPAGIGTGLETNFTKYVNPFIGTAGDGNTFPGATLPFGMMQWSPDTTTNGFYKYHDSTIRGFSLTHLSGAGCPIYADVPFLPVVGPIKSSPATNLSDYTSAFSHENERAAPGSYSVELTSGVRVKLSVTARTGFAVFTYPSSQEASLLISAGGSAKGNSSSSVKIIDRNQVVGSATSGGFCGSRTSYTIYFAAQFDSPFRSFGTWDGANVNPDSRSSSGKQSGAFLTFDTATNQAIKVKVGISFVSIQNALLNLNTENSGWDFEAIRRNADAAWDEWLGHIRVEGGTREQKEIFYTALYHSLISPNVFSDANGEYIGFDQKVHTARDHTHYANFSDWDTYRTLIQLQALLAPRETSDMMQSLVVDAEQSGWLPNWALANDVADVMGGDNPVPLITTAYAFGARNFDARAALRYMLKGATQPGPGAHGYMERPRLQDYLQRGYVPLYTLGSDNGIVGSASTTLEYTNDDFAIAQFAGSLGDSAAHESFMRRAQNWQKLFDAEIGFIRPRRASGLFLEGFDVERITPHSEVPWDKSNQAGFQEGNSWQYTWMVPYNYRGLFQAIGGNAEVIRRLDKFFTELVGWGKPYFNMANEPSFVAPYAYTFAGAPWRTQRIVRRIRTETFRPTPDGLPGNDDLGATSAWYLWSAIGLYPAIPSVGGFVISGPSFPSITLRLGDGRGLRILAERSSASSSYVERLTLNDKSYSHAWLPIETIRSGMTTLKFTLADQPNTTWASNPAEAPPSFAEGQAPAIGFIYGDDSFALQRGDVKTVSLGMRKIVATPLIVKWSAEVPQGLSLRPSSGILSINRVKNPSLNLQLSAAAQLASGTYMIQIKSQAISESRRNSTELPRIVLEVKVSSVGLGQ